MTMEDFRNKLYWYFTGKQIENLNRYGLTSALDAHGDEDDIDMETLASMGREFVCIQLYELADDYETTKARYEEIAGGYFSEESYDDLMEMFDDEW